MTPEDRLTQVLHAEASQVDPPTQWNDVEGGLAARRRTRRLRQATLSTMAAAALVAGVLALVADDDRESGLRVVPPATQPQKATVTTAPATATTTSVPVRVPTEVLVAGVDAHESWLAILDPGTGRTIRELVRFDRGGEEATAIYSVAASPNGKTVYYTTGNESGIDRLYEVPRSGGVAREVGDHTGGSLGINSRGDRLAFAAFHNAGIYVRDLRTGVEERWSEQRRWSFIGVAFLNDSQLAASVGVVGDPAQIRILDGAGSDLDSARWLEPPIGTPSGTSWRLVTVRPDGMLVVHETCCGSFHEDNAYASATVAVVDPGPVAVLSRRILPVVGPHTVVADSSGQHLLVLHGCQYSACELAKLDGDRLLPLAPSVAAAAW